jgi:hypothetical protein
MHLNFAFNAAQIIWTLTFAAHLILLVVLFGRDRARRFPWFTAAIALVALRLVSTRLLFGRLPQIELGRIFIVLADVSAVVGLLVVVELFRAAFYRASRRFSLNAAIAVLALGGVVLVTWGLWPAWKTLKPTTPMAVLGIMQLFAQKAGLLVDVSTVALGLLVAMFGRRYGAGWRGHAQRIVIGLSTASLAQLAVQVIWQAITKTAVPHSMSEYQRIIGLREKLFNANSVVYLLVIIWWIACLWIDEPGSATADTTAPVLAGPPERKASTSVQPPSHDLGED